MAIIIEDGLDALTIARLADRLGAAVGALYRYFPGKEGLIVALQQRALSSLRDYLTRRAAAAAATTDEAPARPAALSRVLTVFRAYLDHQEAAPSTHRLVSTFMSTPAPILPDAQAASLLEVIDGNLAVVVGELEHAAAVAALAAGDARIRTYVGWATIHGLDHFRKRDRLLPSRLHSHRLFRDAFDTLLRGWGADEAMLASAWELCPKRGR